jgi:hypothetical protein
MRKNAGWARRGAVGGGLLLWVMVGLFQAAQAQDHPDWSVLMQDPNWTVEEVRAAYEAHWSNKVKGPGTGYKPIERWLHLGGLWRDPSSPARPDRGYFPCEGPGAAGGWLASQCP